MKTICLCGLSFVLLTGVLSAQTIDNRQFVSSSLNGLVVPVTTYLPAGYSTSAPPYRVYIFLHGAGGDTHSTYVSTVTYALEQAIAEGIAEPMVVVFPGFAEAAPGYEYLFLSIHCYRNSVRNGPFEDAVMIDLMNWLYTTSGYNISADRGDRAIGGFSDGAVGCAYLAVKHCDQFLAFVAHSGGLALREFEYSFLPLLLAETPGPPYTFDPANGLWSEFSFGRASAFSPNLVDPNYPAYLVDFPVDSSGALIPAVFDDRWIPNHDPATLIADPAIYTDPVHMYISCNTGDVFYASNQRFSDELTALGIRHKFQSYGGGHSLTILTVKNSLRWLTNRFNDPPSDVHGAGGRPQDGFWLGQNRPNPFDAVTTIPFSILRSANVEISVFNVHGQRVRSLMNGPCERGTHCVLLPAAGMASGMYWVELKADGRRAARKMILAR